jgi:hypothetical protein
MTQNASKKALTPAPEGFDCTFCGKTFKYEKVLIKHLCKKKQRFLERERQDVRLGYIAYRLFYQLNYANPKVKTPEQFRESNVYDAFVKFGKYVIDVKAIAPEEFIRFAVNSKRPLDRWTLGDVLYNEYVKLLNRHESFDRALERTILLAESWANQNKAEIKNFLREVAPGQAVLWIQSGKISPWVLFNCESGHELMTKLSEEQFSIVEKAIDTRFWKKKFKDHPDEATAAQEFLRSEGL